MQVSVRLITSEIVSDLLPLLYFSWEWCIQHIVTALTKYLRPNTATLYLLTKAHNFQSGQCYSQKRPLTDYISMIICDFDIFNTSI